MVVLPCYITWPMALDGKTGSYNADHALLNLKLGEVAAEVKRTLGTCVERSCSSSSAWLVAAGGSTPSYTSQLHCIYSRALLPGGGLASTAILQVTAGICCMDSE